MPIWLLLCELRFSPPAWRGPEMRCGTSRPSRLSWSPYGLPVSWQVMNVSDSPSIRPAPPLPLRHMDVSGTIPPPRSKSVPRPPPPFVLALRVPVISAGPTSPPLVAVLFAPLLPARPSIVGAILSCVSRLGGESRRMLSNSNNISAGSALSPKQKTRNRRARRWAKPKYWASRMRHAAVPRGPETTPALSHPAGGVMASSAPTSPASKQPKALSSVERTPGTFSQRVILGRIACTTSIKRRVRLPRSSRSDFRKPATLNAWQGVPAISKSTGIARSVKSGAVISPRFSNPGLRSAIREHGNGSISAHHFQSTQGIACSGARIPLHIVAPVIPGKYTP